MVMTEKGPRFIELGARLHGSINPDIIVKCTGGSHVTALVDSVVDKENYLKKIMMNPYTELKEKAFCVALISKQEGRLKALPHIDKIRTLTSFYDVSIHVEIGDIIHETKNLLTSPGEVYLIHKDRNVLLNDYKKIRELEGQDFFIIEN